VPLARHFVTLICRDLGRAPLRIGRQESEALERHDWPGNIRELRNVIERAIIMSKGERLRLELAMGAAKSRASDVTTDEPFGDDLRTDAEMRELEKTNLLVALRMAKGRISGDGGAADLLGLKPSTLAYRMRRIGIGS
jgi:DNA-binding NtrC family response regulator